MKDRLRSVAYALGAAGTIYLASNGAPHLSDSASGCFNNLSAAINQGIETQSLGFSGGWVEVAEENLQKGGIFFARNEIHSAEKDLSSKPSIRAELVAVDKSLETAGAGNVEKLGQVRSEIQAAIGESQEQEQRLWDESNKNAIRFIYNVALCVPLGVYAAIVADKLMKKAKLIGV